MTHTLFPYPPLFQSISLRSVGHASYDAKYARLFECFLLGCRWPTAALHGPTLGYDPTSGVSGGDQHDFENAIGRAPKRQRANLLEDTGDGFCMDVLVR